MNIHQKRLNQFMDTINDILHEKGYAGVSWGELKPMNESDRDFISSAMVVFDRLLIEAEK